MHKLVAVEPTAFNSYADIKALFGNFGFHEGKFVAQYPKHWRRLVIENLDRLPDLERKRAVEWLNRAVNAGKIERRSFAYDFGRGWIDNACARYNAGDVAGVIVASKSQGIFPSLEDVDDDYFFGICGRQADVPSTSDGYSEAARVLLTRSNILAIFDPYLSTFRTGYKKVLSRFAELAANSGRCRQFIFYSIDQKSSPKLNENSAREFFSEILNAGISVSYRVIEDRCGSLEADDHFRVLVSDVGAMMFDKGFEEEKGAKLRKVSLLDPPMHKKLFSQYIEGRLPFDITWQCDLEAADPSGT